MRNKNDGRGRMGGRKKGSSNKVTKDLRLWVKNLISSNTELLEKDFLDLEPQRRLQIVSKLLDYVLPKEQKVDLHYLNEEQLNEVINEVSNNVKK